MNEKSNPNARCRPRALLFVGVQCGNLLLYGWIDSHYRHEREAKLARLTLTRQKTRPTRRDDNKETLVCKHSKKSNTLHLIKGEPSRERTRVFIPNMVTSRRMFWHQRVQQGSDRHHLHMFACTSEFFNLRRTLTSQQQNRKTKLSLLCDRRHKSSIPKQEIKHRVSITPCVIAPQGDLLICHIKPRHLLWYGSEGTGGVTGRTPPPLGRESARNTDAIQRLFVFWGVTIWWSLRWAGKPSAAGFTCPFVLLFSRSRVKGVTSVWVKTKHAGGSTGTRPPGTSALPSTHSAPSKQRAGRWGEPPCDQSFVMPMRPESREAGAENHNGCGRAPKWRRLQGGLMTADGASAAEELRGLLLREPSVIVSFVSEEWPC